MAAIPLNGGTVAGSVHPMQEMDAEESKPNNQCEIMYRTRSETRGKVY
jgi:hypothetical protein